VRVRNALGCRKQVKICRRTSGRIRIAADRHEDLASVGEIDGRYAVANRQ
jgi:hypothetical protein